MIFHEIYSLYYKTVTCLIQSSFTHVNEIINENAFKESFMMLEEALERWPIKNPYKEHRCLYLSFDTPSKEMVKGYFIRSSYAAFFLFLVFSR